MTYDNNDRNNYLFNIARAITPSKTLLGLHAFTMGYEKSYCSSHTTVGGRTRSSSVSIVETLQRTIDKIIRM